MKEILARVVLTPQSLMKLSLQTAPISTRSHSQHLGCHEVKTESIQFTFKIMSFLFQCDYQTFMCREPCEIFGIQNSFRDRVIKSPACIFPALLLEKNHVP